MPKSVIIIGSGMGGLAAGIYGQMNRFDTRIYEMNHRPGGQCVSWKRGGYVFDACIHHLMGCSPNSKIYQFWLEIGAMPAELVYTKECVSVADLDGRLFNDYYDLDILEKHLCTLSSQDAKIIRAYVKGIRDVAEYDMMGDMITGNFLGLLGHTLTILRNLKWFRLSMADFAKRFTDPFLQRAFPLLVYSNPSVPVFLHLMRHASGLNRDIAWPVGASMSFVDGIVDRYNTLGGRLYCRKRVTKIITGNGRAVGVRLDDGTEEFADVIISNADGRKTLLELLDGRYMDKRLKAYCAEPADISDFAVNIFLGVDRDLSKEPSSLILLLDQPVILAGHEFTSLEMQMYGFDQTMAPEGKGVIKIELKSAYSYWKKLSADRKEYEAEKQRVAVQVIALLENRFPGISRQIESIDVSTLLTWERFMGGTHGFANFPNKKPNIWGSLFNSREMTLSGLDNFYFVGAWATSAGALFLNALSGKKAIKRLCEREHLKFEVSRFDNSIRTK
ncbi:amine oxidase [Syntrophobotulus glycolicus DSM 8271]|uniref:Amine oxidase n=1 Tax=Syntrophobotulus glycolicus (strain DSM 8271 / FlGlyR) TaxID=645991 RepID=F0SVP7_SYNGF|nr:NAD(P)/FAD-dependent oxidoreductase [Syntrophobotulus glycolicus]ADY54523.1 amine oxidase [Syntrophobotulus glycolicus DSM 8271]